MKLSLLKKFCESSVHRIQRAQLFAFRITLTLLFCCICTIAFAQNYRSFTDNTLTATSLGRVTAATAEGITLHLIDEDRPVEFKAPAAADSTPRHPKLDPATAALFRQMRVGDVINLRWESRGGQRIPTGIRRLSPDAITDLNTPPTPLNPALLTPERLTERGGYFDLIETTDLAMIVYDRINNAVSGQRDLYRMYADGRLPLCITCFLNPRPRAVLGNPVWLNDATHVAFQMANENATTAASNDLAGGINHDLWALDLETRAMTRLVASQPGDGIAGLDSNGAQLSFSQRIDPAHDGASGGSAMLERLRDPLASGWHLRRASFRPGTALNFSNGTSPGQRRMISYPGTPMITGLVADEDARLDGIFTQGADRRIQEQLVLRRNPTLPPRRQAEHLLGPALYDGGRRLLVYSSSRAVNDGFLGRAPEQKSTDLFIRFIGDITYQLTDHQARGRDDGDIYQILDLDWSRDRRMLLVAIAARNPITEREQETEIWRYDLGALLDERARINRPAGGQ